MKIQVIDDSGKSVIDTITVTNKQIIVFKYDGHITDLMACRIKNNIKKAIDGEKILLLDKNSSLQVFTIVS